MTDIQQPHEWVKSQLGHGHLMCKHCKATPAELSAIALLYDNAMITYDIMNVCKKKELGASDD